MLGYPESRPRWPETELECFAAKRRTGEMAPVGFLELGYSPVSWQDVVSQEYHGISMNIHYKKDSHTNDIHGEYIPIGFFFTIHIECNVSVMVQCKVSVPVMVLGIETRHEMIR